MERSSIARRFRAETGIMPNPGHPGAPVQEYWASTLVSVFDGDRPVGRYERNYPQYGVETFEPFEWRGAWYALYSRNYTCTRIMSLPDCRDIGGEEPDGAGFCPVELFVPRYRVVKTWRDGIIAGVKSFGESWKFESWGETYPEGPSEQPIGPNVVRHEASAWQTLGTAFVAGCVWGDDSSWKLQTFDLTRVHEGVITRAEPFGYLPLAAMPLAKALSLSKEDYATTSTNPQLPSHTGGHALRVRIARYESRDLATGAVADGDW